MSSKAYVMTTDFSLMFETSVAIEIDPVESTSRPTSLWSPAEERTGLGRLVYKSRSGQKKLGAYDYYPGDGTLAIVSDRLKQLFVEICHPDDLGVVPCELRIRGSRLDAWVLYPAHTLPIVDRKLSIIDWYVPDLKPDKVKVKTSDKIVFASDCLNGHDFVRWDEARRFLIVSERLKNAIEALNPQGIWFLEDRQLRFKNRQFEWRSMSNI